MRYNKPVHRVSPDELERISFETGETIQFTPTLAILVTDTARFVAALDEVAR